ncbi:MAG: nucleotide exchange factor GrpE [Polyangiaceae bacterium]
MGDEKLQRALDDLSAAEARVERNAQRVYEESRSKVALELLPVLDNLDRTLLAASDPNDPIVTGVTMVRAQLEGVLLRFGVERVDAMGKAFNPAEHEAVLGVPVEDDALVGSVVEQVSPGYRLGARLLRPARVQVGMKAELVT